MSGLVSFVLARIAEDELRLMPAAQTAPASAHWACPVCAATITTSQAVRRFGDGRDVGIAVAEGHDWEVTYRPFSLHVRCPRVLAECEAKRALISEAQFALSFVLNNTCRILARPYADHPDFREEWR